MHKRKVNSNDSPLDENIYPFEYQGCTYTSYDYTREPPKTYIYVYKIGNLDTVVVKMQTFNDFIIKSWSLKDRRRINTSII